MNILHSKQVQYKTNTSLQKQEVANNSYYTRFIFNLIIKIVNQN